MKNSLKTCHVLLLLCCKRIFRPEDSNKIEETIRAGVDWIELIQTAQSLEINPVLGWALKDLDPSLIPENIANQLRSEYKESIARNILLTDRLIWISRILIDHQISFIPVKGVVLADQVFPGLGLRRIADLDILVKPEDVQNAVSILTQRGLSPGLESFKHLDFEAARDVSLYGIENGFQYVLEVHWKFKDSFLRLPPDLLWKYLVDYEWNGLTLRVLSPELTLLHLVHHLHYHGFTLKILIDVAATLKTYRRTLDWNQILKWASDAKMRWILHLALEAVSQAFGESYPDAALSLRTEFRHHRQWLLKLLTNEQWHFRELSNFIQSHSYNRALFSACFTEGSYFTLFKLLVNRAFLQRGGIRNIAPFLNGQQA